MVSRVLVVALLALGGASAQNCAAPIQLSTATSILTYLKQLQTDVSALKTLTSSNKVRVDDLYSTVVAQSPVKWTKMNCLAAGTDGKITKSGCGNGWNGGAISTRGAFGDATVQFRCSKAQHSMIGISVGNAHNSYTDIDCAIYCDRGNLRVYERGRSKGTFGKYDDNSVFMLKRRGTSIQYSRVGKVFRTCGYKLSGRVLVDLSIYGAGRGGIVAASWVGNVEAIPTAPVQWTGVGCASVGISGMVTKTGCSNGWNGGAVSVQGAYGDIELQFRCTLRQHSMIGLAAPMTAAYSSQTYATIDCATYCDQGNYRFYEKGRNRGTSGRYAESDLLSVKRVGNVVTYWRNGVLKRTCANKLSGYIMADVSIHNTGRGGILEAFWVGTIAPQPMEKPGTTASTGPIKWKNTQYVSIGSNGRMYKTSRNGWNNGGGISTQVTKGNGEVAWRFSRRQYGMIGFAVGDSNKHYNDIDCAMYCAGGNINIYERGRYKGRIGTYSDGTWMSVKRTGTLIQYKIGSSVKKNCGNRLSGNVLVDTSIYYANRGGVIESKWVSRS